MPCRRVLQLPNRAAGGKAMMEITSLMMASGKPFAVQHLLCDTLTFPHLGTNFYLTDIRMNKAPTRIDRTLGLYLKEGKRDRVAEL